MGVVQSPVDGADVFFDDRGEGSPTLVFVHGLTGSGIDFDIQSRQFGASHRIITIDLPGSRGTEKRRSDWSMTSHSRDVVEVIDNLQLNELVLIGHSFGGVAVVEAAAHLRDRVRGVVAVDSFRSLDTVPNDADNEAWLEPFRIDFPAAMEDLTRRNFGPDADPEMVDRVVASARTADQRRVIGILDSHRRNTPALVRYLDDLDIPVYAINGDSRPADRASLEGHGVLLMNITGVGHWPMKEAPEQFNKMLAETVAAIQLSQPS